MQRNKKKTVNWEGILIVLVAVIIIVCVGALVLTTLPALPT